MSGLQSAGLGGPLRAGAWILFGFAALMTAGLSYLVLNGDTAFDAAMLLAPGFPLALGFGLRYVAKTIESGDGPEWTLVGTIVFALVGLASVIGGVVLTFSDPGGLFLIVFGAVFLGAAWLAKKLFVTPEGKKRVLIPEVSVRYKTSMGINVHEQSGYAIYVDEDASDADVEIAVSAWRDKQLRVREDWAENRIDSDAARLGGWVNIGALMWGSLLAIFLVLGMFVDGFFWLMAVPAAAIFVAVTYAAVTNHWSAHKFGENHLVLDVSPATLGQVMTGAIETSLPARDNPPAGFDLSLMCVSRWKSENHTGVEGTEVLRSKELWRREETAKAVMQAGKPGLLVPFSFELPDHLPPSSSGTATTGNHWELTAAADMPGLDYKVAFRLPVALPSDIE